MAVVLSLSLFSSSAPTIPPIQSALRWKPREVIIEMATLAVEAKAAMPLQNDALPNFQKKKEKENGRSTTTVDKDIHAATTQPSISSAAPRLPPLPLCQVDRYWLQKLVAKHSTGVNQQNSNMATKDECDWTKIKIFALAPMVDQSDLPFRLQCRRYGTNLCFTPMIHARLFVTMPKYRKNFCLNKNNPADRPLIAQLCGGADPEVMLQCALQLQDYCDGIDINCGCPQGIAKRGNYGAFLLEQEETLLTLVQYLAPRLKVPLSVKVRLLPGEDKKERVQASLQLYKKLLDAGIHLLTIHGRTRHEKGPLTGAADWAAISTAVQQLGTRIPLLANGSIANAADVLECLQATNADGVMSSEAILEYPPLFAPLTTSVAASTTTNDPAHESNRQMTGNEGQHEAVTNGGDGSLVRVGRLSLAREYLQLALQYPPDQGGQGTGFKCIRVHMHRFLHADLQVHMDIRTALVQAQDVHDLEQALNALEHVHESTNHDPRLEQASWYIRHGNNSNFENYNKTDGETTLDNGEDAESNANRTPEGIRGMQCRECGDDDDDDDDAGDMFGSLF